MQNNANNASKRLLKSPSFRLSIERSSEENAAVRKCALEWQERRVLRFLGLKNEDRYHLIDRRLTLGTWRNFPELLADATSDYQICNASCTLQRVHYYGYRSDAWLIDDAEALESR